MTPLSKSTAGMSLVEIMLASGVLATALSLLFGSLMSISVIGRISEERVAARVELSSVLEDLSDIKTTAQLLSYTLPPLKGPGANHTAVLQAYLAGGTTITLPSVADPLPVLPNPVEVKVTYTWEDDAGHVYQVFASKMVGF